MSTRQFCTISALFFLTIACGSDANNSSPGNSREVVLRDISCASCSIVAESVAFLGHDDDTVAIGQNGLPAIDSRGRLYLGARDGGSVHVFAPGGRLMKTFGKAGSGPGEFAGAREVYVTANDSIIVFGAEAVHIMSPDYEHVREFRIERAGAEFFSNTLLSDGRLLRGRGINDFVLIDRNGVVSPVIVAQEVDTSTFCMECERTFREASQPGFVWSARQDDYRMERHNLNGELQQRIIRDVAWFPPKPAAPPKVQSENPVDYFARPRLMGVRQDKSGILWTHVMMLEGAEELRGKITGDQTKDIAMILANIITRVEAIDPVKGQLLGSINFPQVIFPLVGDYSGQLVADPSGDWTWKIYRFQVKGRE